MGYLRERVAYLRGLAEGMQLDEASNEVKLLKAILEVMDDFALAIDDMEEVQEQMSEQIDNIDADLAEVERIIFDVDEDERDDVCFKEIECPHCHEKIEVNVDAIDEGTTIRCPNCCRDIEVEWDDLCQEFDYDKDSDEGNDDDR